MAGVDYVFPQGAANVTIYPFLIQDNGGTAPGEAATGLTSASAGLDVRYLRPLGSATAISISDATDFDSTDPHDDGQWKEDPNVPGRYRLDLPDAAVASGESFVQISIEADAIVTKFINIMLDPAPSVPPGAVVADGGNTATSFKTNLTAGVDNAFKDALALFCDGALAEQVKEVTASSTTPVWLTVKSAYTATPSDGDRFIIVNR